MDGGRELGAGVGQRGKERDGGEAPAPRVAELGAPPNGERGRIVRAAGRDGERRIRRRVAEHASVVLPAQHAIAGDVERRE